MENPIFLHFINCREGRSRAAFLSRFGFLGRAKVQSMSAFENEQQGLTRRLAYLAAFRYSLGKSELSFPITLRPWIKIPGPGQKQRHVLVPDSLADFMSMEVVLRLRGRSPDDDLRTMWKDFPDWLDDRASISRQILLGQMQSGGNAEAECHQARAMIMSIRKRAWTTSKGIEKTAWMVDYVDAKGTRG